MSARVAAARVAAARTVGARVAAAPGRTAVAVAVVGASLVATVLLHLRHPPLVAMLPLPDMYDLHVDFDTFWHSAVALTQGAGIYDTPAKLTNLNPPLLTVLLTPFAALDALTAYRVFVGFTVLLVVAVVLAVAREVRLTAPATALVVIAVLVSSPLHGTLVLGQIYPLLLAGLAAGWIAERRGRPLLAAVLFGITVALKPSLAPLLLLAAVQRRWVPFRAGVAAAAVATLVGVLVAGPSSAVEWLTIAATEGVPDTVDNASLPGLMLRLGLTAFPGLALGLAVLVGTFVRCRRRDADPAGTAPFAVVAASLLLSPIAWHNYLMLLLPGVLLLLAHGRRALVAALLAVAVVPVSWNAIWGPDTGPLVEVWVADVGRSLYCAVLVAYWVSLLSAARASVTAAPGSPGVAARVS